MNWEKQELQEDLDYISALYESMSEANKIEFMYKAEELSGWEHDKLCKLNETVTRELREIKHELKVKK